jgi:hypothetical protein
MKLMLITLLALAAANTHATTYLSTTTNATIGALAITSGDLAGLDPLHIELPGRELFGATTGFNGSNKNLDAIARYGDGWLYSTSTDHTHNGVTFLDGDLVLWQPGLGAALFMPESVFSGDEDIDALEVMADGRLLISTDSSATLGSLTFTSADVVSYDLLNNTASIFFRGGGFFDATENIDALALLPDTSMLFSTATDAGIGGWAFRDGDVIRYDGTAFSLWLSEGIFGADEDIDALAVTVPVPVPGTAILLAAGLAALFLKQERKL